MQDTKLEEIESSYGKLMSENTKASHRHREILISYETDPEQCKREPDCVVGFFTNEDFIITQVIGDL